MTNISLKSNKILFITPSYKPAYIYGGPIFSVSTLAEALVDIGYEVDVFTTTANGESELDVETNSKYDIDGVNVYYFSRQTKDHSHFSIGLFKKLWQDVNKYSVIHIHSWWNLIAIISLIICSIKGKKTILSPRGMLSPYTINNSIFKRFFQKYIGSKLLKKAILHVTSDDEKNKVLNYETHLNIVCIPNLINLNIPEVIKNDNITNNITLLFISRIHSKKGLEDLLYAIESIDGVKLNIIGDGDFQYIHSLKILANKLNIESKIKWLGPIYDTNLKSQYFQEADFMVLPSKDENFANNIIESLLYSTPVITTTEVGLADFIITHNLGWIYNSANTSLKSVLLEATMDLEKRNFIIRNANRIVKVEFNNNNLISQYIKLLYSNE